MDKTNISEPVPIVRLVIRSGPDCNRRFVTRKKNIHIGRAETCELRLDDLSVAGRHALIEYANGTYSIEVLDSDWPVLCDGKRISKTKLEDGDTLCIGDFEVQFYVVEPMPFYHTRRRPWIQQAALLSIVLVIVMQCLLLVGLWILHRGGLNLEVPALFKLDLVGANRMEAGVGKVGPENETAETTSGRPSTGR